MAYNKFITNNTTLLDLTGDDLTNDTSKVANGYKYHGRDGVQYTGTGSGGGSAYSITTNITNGTASGATGTYPDATGTTTTAQVTITPASNYALPTSVTVVGATSNYNATTGVITLTNATGNVTITAVCVALYTITPTITNGTSTGDSSIVAGGTASITIVPDLSYDTPASVTVTGASYTYDRNTGVVSLSNPTGNVTIAGDCVATAVYKGKIINMDMDGDGTDEQYRVLKLLSGDVVEVVALNYVGVKEFSDTSSCVYENSVVDSYINTTYYNTLSSTAKTAIVDKTITQEMWGNDTTGTPTYIGRWERGTYDLSLHNNAYGNTLTRHAYLLSLQDIIDYLEVTPQMTADDTTLTYSNIAMMLQNSSSITTQRFLRVIGVSENKVGLINTNGYINTEGANNVSQAVYPAFQIDLSKISWS